MDNGLDARIEQMAMFFPSVFNFYMPDYEPPGPAAQARLFARGGDRDSPVIMGFLNGAASLLRFGGVVRGFGSPDMDREGCHCN